MTAAIVSALVGGSLLVLLLVDVLLPVFHPQGHGGPLHRLQNRFLWAVLKRFGRSRGGHDRPRFLALCGPVIAIVSVASWGLWLIVGYGLIYFPFGDAFRTTVANGVPSVDAFYYSGYVASTLGLGDIVPAAPGLRLLTVLEAMSGFALFAVATTVTTGLILDTSTGSRTGHFLAASESSSPLRFWRGGRARRKRWPLGVKGQAGESVKPENGDDMVNNFVLAYFLGLCPFLGVSGRLRTSFRLGLATTFVMVITAVWAWVLNTFVLVYAPYLRLIAFIVVIASTVQFLEMVIKKLSPALFRALGIFLPLITTNCAILGLALFATNRGYGLAEGVVFAFGAGGAGFTLALVLLAGLREETELADVPAAAEGTAGTLIMAGILSMAFMGFAGLFSSVQ